MTATPPGFPPLLRAAALVCALATVAAGCAPAARGREAFDVREITPAFLLPLEARDPWLAADAHGNVVLTWVAGDSASAGVWLSVSRDTGANFSAPVRVSLPGAGVRSTPEGRPTAAIGPGGALAIAWSEWRGDSTGAIDLRARASADLGRTFGNVTTLNDDVAGPPPGLRWRQLRDWPLTHRPDAFHGFPALAFAADGSLLAGWLDDRRTPAPLVPRLHTLWRSVSADGGRTWSPNVALCDSACPGCRPALATAADGAVALAYRDGANDLGDPRLTLSFDGGHTFTTDTLVSRDGWRVAGGAGQGPALVWDQPAGGHYAWYTGAEPAGVYVARWRRTGGATGPRRPAADSLAGAAHPLAASVGGAVVIGVASIAPGDPSRHTLAVRLLGAGGEWSPWTFLGADAGTAALVAAGSRRAIACWVEHEAGRTRLRLASLTPGNGTRG